MTRRSCILARLAYVLLAIAPVVLHGRGGQDRQSAVNVPLLRINAVVTDRQGHAIDGLGISDFEVIENGASRPVRAAEFRTVPRHSSAEILPVDTLQEEARAAREPGTRLFAFFLDDFHVSPGASADRARAAVASFIDEKVFARDLAVVMRPLDPVSSIRFTRDRAVLHGEIAGFAGRKGDYAPRTPFEEQYIGRHPAAVIAARRRIVSASLRQLAMRLGDLEADRAVIVLVSEGFPAGTLWSDGRPSDLRAAARLANRFHLTIYTFNPAAPHEDVAPAEERRRALAMLEELAAQTGGLAVQPDGFIAGFARVAHDTEAYYALTYEPAQVRGTFHPIDVRVRGRQAHVRTQAGYWFPIGDQSNVSASLPPALPAVSRRLLRRSPLVDTWMGMRHNPSGGTRMVIVWEPRARGARSPHIAAIRARTVAGAELFDGRVAAVGAKSPSEQDSAWFDVPGGRVEVDMTLLDRDGKVLDTEVGQFDVPDVRSSNEPGPVLLSTEIVRRRTWRDFQQARENLDATPSAARTFARADQLLIRVGAVDATGLDVRVTAKVLGRAGHPMRDLQGDAPARDKGLTQFALPLSWLAPGDYQIELAGTNANGSVKERLAFRVVH